MKFSLKVFGFAACMCMGSFCLGDEFNPPEVEEMVVTGARMETPLSIETNPKLPRQPLPAQDGAEYLKTLPGFSVVRKGGAGGDPVFRGMAGSRLSMLMDGSMLLGGCDSRMDPPTAYVFPETYDRIRLIKGPQTVLYGPGNSAGVVLFERDRQRPDAPGWRFHGSLLTGGFGRNDEALDIQGGTPDFLLRGTAGHSQQDNYEDGDGNEVHSRYDRWNAELALGWTPSDDVLVEIGGGRSDAEAAYADRAMDGAEFLREHFSLKLILENPASRWRKLEAQIYSNYVDHVMDNFSLRRLEGMMMTSDRDRQTRGVRVVATFDPFASTELTIGMDGQTNEHTVRETMDQMMMPYQDMPRMEDARFRQAGIFGEWTQRLTERQRLITGLRIDDWRTEDRRETIALGMGHGMMSGMMPVDNPTAGEAREETLSSGFLRYERDLQAVMFYVGLGRSERFPDYWELIGEESPNSVSAFGVSHETTRQLDAGIIYRAARVRGSVSLFYNRIEDYLLIQSGVPKPMGMAGGMMDMRSAAVTRNVDATSRGVEADMVYALTRHWRVEASLTAVRGDNETDDTPLAQMPPLELRLGLNYESAAWSAGVFWRGVNEQTRVDIGKGNIAGQDIGPSDGFNVFSINTGWRIGDNLLVTAGIDNLLDEIYAEHISRAGTMIEGFEQATRVNEPGRNAWVKARWNFE